MHTLKFYILVSANSPFQDFSKILFPFFDPSAFLFYPFPQGLVCYASVSHFCSLSANEQVLFVLTFHIFFSAVIEYVRKKRHFLLDTNNISEQNFTVLLPSR